MRIPERLTPYRAPRARGFGYLGQSGWRPIQVLVGPADYRYFHGTSVFEEIKISLTNPPRELPRPVEASFVWSSLGSRQEYAPPSGSELWLIYNGSMPYSLRDKPSTTAFKRGVMKPHTYEISYAKVLVVDNGNQVTDGIALAPDGVLRDWEYSPRLIDKHTGEVLTRGTAFGLSYVQQYDASGVLVSPETIRGGNGNKLRIFPETRYLLTRIDEVSNSKDHERISEVVLIDTSRGTPDVIMERIPSGMKLEEFEYMKATRPARTAAAIFSRMMITDQMAVDIYRSNAAKWAKEKDEWVSARPKEGW